MQSVWRHYWIAVGVLVVAMPLPAYLAQQQSTPLRRPLASIPRVTRKGRSPSRSPIRAM